MLISGSILYHFGNGALQLETKHFINMKHVSLSYLWKPSNPHEIFVGEAKIFSRRFFESLDIFRNSVDLEILNSKMRAHFVLHMRVIMKYFDIL